MGFVVPQNFVVLSIDFKRSVKRSVKMSLTTLTNYTKLDEIE